MVLTIQVLCSSAREEVDLELVGEEDLMESTHALISRFFKTLLLGMGMYPGAASGFCATAMSPLIPDFVLDTIAFCVIFTADRSKLLWYCEYYRVGTYVCISLRIWRKVKVLNLNVLLYLSPEQRGEKITGMEEKREYGMCGGDDTAPSFYLYLL